MWFIIIVNQNVKQKEQPFYHVCEGYRGNYWYKYLEV